MTPLFTKNRNAMAWGLVLSVFPGLGLPGCRARPAAAPHPGSAPRGSSVSPGRPQAAMMKTLCASHTRNAPLSAYTAPRWGTPLWCGKLLPRSYSALRRF